MIGGRPGEGDGGDVIGAGDGDGHELDVASITPPVTPDLILGPASLGTAKQRDPGSGAGVRWFYLRGLKSALAAALDRAPDPHRLAIFRHRPSGDVEALGLEQLHQRVV